MEGLPVAGCAPRAGAALVDTALAGASAVVIWRRRDQARTRIPRRQSWDRRLGMYVLKAAYVVGTTVFVGGSPGTVLLGLRVVDRRTGTTPGWRQAALRWAVGAVPGIAIGEIVRAGMPDRMDRWRRRNDQIAAAVDRLPDPSPEAIDATVKAMEPSARTMAGLMGLPAIGLACGAAWLVVRLLDPECRSFADRVAGTVVVHAGRRRRGPAPAT